MNRGVRLYHRPRDLLARIAELEQLGPAASFADLQELASLERRKIRRMQEGTIQ